MKIMMWLTVIGLVIAALYVRRSSGRADASRLVPAEQTDRHGTEIMLQCTHCGVYFPASEALRLRGMPYCSQEHLGKPATH